MLEPKIQLIDSFITNSQDLFVILEKDVAWDERMRARKTASFGVTYNYSGITYPQTNMPAYLIEICKKIQVTIGFMPNNCLMNYYPDGSSSMGYHSDSSAELLEGTGVAVLSLGAERHIWYKSKTDKNLIYKYKMKSGALLYMDNAVQEQWLHAIPKENNVTGRISLTFRNIIK